MNARRPTLLEIRTADLLNHCVNGVGWDLPYDSPVITGFLNAAPDEVQVGGKWSSEFAFDTLYFLLEDFSHEDGIATPVSASTVENFLKRFSETMNQGISENWIILPIHRAILDNVISFGDYHFLPNKMPRDEKIIYLASAMAVDSREMMSRAKHTEATRSPDFYQYTLLCHKMNHFTPWVDVMSVKIGVLDLAFLRIVHNSIELKTRRTIDFEIERTPSLRTNRHVIVAKAGHRWWNHHPIWAGHNSTYLPMNLAWLNEPINQTKLQELSSLLNYEKRIDSLTYRFRKAVILFNRAINLQQDARRGNEGFALEVLHLMISAESLILERENEKRLRLAVLLSRLVEAPGKSTLEIYQMVDELYNWRSDYVHSGNDVFPEYDEDFHEGDVQLKVYLLRYVISRLITEAPKWISLAKNNVLKDEQSIMDRASEKAWFRYLNRMWQSVLSGQSNK